MIDKTIGFIGGGNMASAMIGGMINSRLCHKEQIIVTARTQSTLDRLSAAYDIRVTLNNKEAAQFSDILFLAVKPYAYEEIIKEIKNVVSNQKIIVSIAAGINHAKLNSYFGKPLKIIRAMPNTPAMVLEAMTALTPNEFVSKKDLKNVTDIFKSFGKAEIVPESLMSAVIGVSGSSPAYVYMLIEAMADAAVADGMPRVQAYKFAAQAVSGAAKMVLETGRHPGELKDAVCSPKGTTIEAVAKLEQEGFRNAIICAQRSCVAKSENMENS